ncbi:MAG: M61 family metallopeptidase [Microcystaceae cyanobacterium]
MTEATAIKPTVNAKICPEIHYQVSMPHPTYHLFEVMLTVKNWSNDTLNLKMPVWTPGSYLVREYSKNLQGFTAYNGQTKERLGFSKISKNHWQIATENITEVIVSYQMYANELTVRTNHLDQTHGYFNGAALFFYIPTLEKEPITIRINPPQDWQVATALPCLSPEKSIYQADDFDTLVDSPFEIGIHQRYEFEVENKPHQWVIWGEGNFNPQQMIEDTTKIIEVESKLYGGLPYDDYLFLLHVSGSGYGGLEHKTCCTLNYPRLGFRATDKYNRFMQLVAHEFFHLWNIKRIRPKALETFDYDQENYTPSLWFAEGATSYYDILIPLRAGIYDSKKFLENISKDITRFLQIPGRLVQPLSESSFDAWIKLYRRDANSDNSQISYYLKGELICLLLDLWMRSQSDHQRTLDYVMRLMWERFGQAEIGYTPQQLQQTFEEVAQTDLTDFFKRYLHGTEELPFDDYLEPFGLTLKPIHEAETFPYLGVKVQKENNKEMIKFVEIESPAAIAGIDAGDELLAINGIRVSAEQLNERLKDYQTGDMMQITVFHQDELRTLSVQLAPPQPSRYEIVTLADPSEYQQQNLTKWLKSDR